MKITIKHNKGSGHFAVDVALYNRGDCLGIDFNNSKSQILLENVSAANARSMIRELELYIQSKKHNQIP